MQETYTHSSSEEGLPKKPGETEGQEQGQGQEPNVPAYPWLDGGHPSTKKKPEEDAQYPEEE